MMLFYLYDPIYQFPITTMFSSGVGNEIGFGTSSKVLEAMTLNALLASYEETSGSWA
jgi:hypothetical protein